MIRFGIKIICRSSPNILPNQDENISTSNSPIIFVEESICAYNILIVHQEDVNSYDNVRHLEKEEIYEFFSKPSIIACLSDKEISYQGPYVLKDTEVIQYSTTNYDWLPDIQGLVIVNKRGKGLITTSDTGKFNNLFNSYNWEWKCSYSKLPPKYKPIAYNLSNIPVALKEDIGEGRVYIIPTPDVSIYDYNKYPAFLRQLIDVCEEEIEELERTEIKEPDWVEQYVDPLELKLLGDWTPFYQRYTTLRGARKLFYETGIGLTRIVQFVISAIGFNAEIKEQEAIQDIEIDEDDFYAVIEVTSSKEHWIDISKTRQLLDWCRKCEQRQNKKPKGILISNSYCSLSPEDRDVPFTPKAIEQGEDEGFCLITTVQLYEIFCKFLKGVINKEQIKKLFLDTKGLLNLEGQ